MSTMKSVAIKDGKGPLENLYITDDTPRPTPKAGELLIKIHAFGINRMDLIQREGRYPVPPSASPILGVEFSGVVEEVGPIESSSSSTAHEHSMKKGDKVFGLAYGGAYAEYITNPSKMCIPLPAELSFTQAAGLPEVWFTALQALYVVGSLSSGPSSNDKVLIHAGASGVGLAAIQLCRAAGCARIYCTASTSTKLDLCRRLGATHGINYKTHDYATEILREQEEEGVAEQDRGVNYILDFIGAPYWSKNMQLAKLDCVVVYLATLGGTKTEIDLTTILYKRLRIQGSTLRSRSPEYQGKLRDLFEDLALENLKTGDFVAHIDKVYPWTRIQDAQGRMQRNEGDGGKIICEIIPS